MASSACCQRLPGRSGSVARAMSTLAVGRCGMTRCPLQLQESRAGNGVMSVLGITACHGAGCGIATGAVMLPAPHFTKISAQPPEPVGSGGAGKGRSALYAPPQGVEPSYKHCYQPRGAGMGRTAALVPHTSLPDGPSSLSGGGWVGLGSPTCGELLSSLAHSSR